jgi:hypothetical protein
MEIEDFELGIAGEESERELAASQLIYKTAYHMMNSYYRHIKSHRKSLCYSLTLRHK